MKHQITVFYLLFLGFTFLATAQDQSDYVEFNDRKNVVHGVYLGFSTHYGQIKGKGTYLAGAKVAYVANHQFEIGFEGVGFYSEQDYRAPGISNKDLYGGYGGLHLEPIFFGSSRVNLSFPLLIGAGAVGYTYTSLRDTFDYGDPTIEDWDPFFIVEPGASLLFNISRYVQLELGAKYRFSSSVRLYPDGLKNIDGFSTGIGVKIGVFNMGRNRYKKNI